MIDVAERPRRGLGPDEALAKWSDPELYGELVRISGRSPPPANIPHTAAEFQKAMDYSKRWQELEDAFVNKLREGVLFCTAIEDGADDRQWVKPSLWDVLEIAFDVGFVAGNKRQFNEPEFFDGSAIPLNAEPIPDWFKQHLDREARRFRHSADYRQISFNGIKFEFGEKQAQAVRILHEASRTGNPRRKGSCVLEQAGSGLTKMIDLFRSQKQWRRLIESVGKGSYRLKIDVFGNPLSD